MCVYIDIYGYSLETQPNHKSRFGVMSNGAAKMGHPNGRVNQTLMRWLVNLH